MKKFILILFLFPFSVLAQYKGIWNGFLTAENRTYRSYYILDVKEEFDGLIKGDAYIYRTNYLSFLGKMNFIGTIDGNKLHISELKLLINQRPITKEDFCYKNMVLELITKDSIIHLTGPWEGALANNAYRCDPGDVFLRRLNKEGNGLDPIPDDILAQIKKTELKPDSFLNTALTIPKVIDVQGKNVKIQISDYEKIDGDIVSVYLNREKVIDKAEIKKRPIERTVRLSQLVQINELVVYAHNLGEISPNTCMMTVDDGITIQKVFIESSLQKSALLYLRYKPVK
ncbi:hypothetical protein [Pedobacter cryophilus]|uniref:Uncharacterized protein n=1 Tax=Pedobacter cryophilus TaxID=2571271 RepID=A0A4U1C005_9SPHI|nr:hypothetical protein [Pedobacter cryophilus]TKB98888.1 hypothetical protein FA046_07170 [Pedobacter cryophilus]